MQTDQIWKEYHDKLYGFVFKRVRDSALTEDILQDVFEKIHTQLPSLRKEDKLHSWLYQITRNRITDHFRSHLKAGSSVALPDIAQTEEETSELLEAARCCLQRFIGELPEDSRKAIEKTYFTGKSQKEIAEEENITYTAYKSRVQRARETLQEWISDCCKKSSCASLTSAGEKKCDC